MNKYLASAGLVILLGAGGYFVWDNRTSMESDVSSTSSKENEQGVRACNDPRPFGMEDDGLRYDVRLKMGENCQDPMGVTFRFDRYYMSNNQFAGDVTVIDKSNEIPVTLDTGQQLTANIVLHDGSLTMRLCGIGESIKTPEGSIRLMVSRAGDPVCPE